MENYQLPFEKEVGSHPTLEDMSKCVVDKRLRPHIHDSWRRNAVSKKIEIYFLNSISF